MQNRYFGDIGDFGKYGMLREIVKTDLKLGVNWYLFPNESHNNDGKHKEYLHYDKNQLSQCGHELYLYLKTILEITSNEQLTIKLIENSGLLSGVKFSHEFLDIAPHKDKKIEIRRKWFQKSITEIEDSNIIFCDPDNGFEVPSVSHTEKKAGKYIFFEEAKNMYDSGKSLVVYNHGPLWFKQGQMSEYVLKITDRIKSNVTKEAIIACLQWQTTAKRFYFWIIRPEHKQQLYKSINQVTSGEWGKHFKVIEISEGTNSYEI